MNQLTKAAYKKLETSYKRVLEGDMYRYELTGEERHSYTKPFSSLSSRKKVVAVPTVPPLDVAFCWLLQRLSPLDYIEDCRKLFGVPLPADNGLDYIFAQNTVEERGVIARLQWCSFAQAVRELELFE